MPKDPKQSRALQRRIDRAELELKELREDLAELGAGEDEDPDESEDEDL